MIFNWSLVNFSVEQMVTAGNGIIPIDVVLSSKLTMTGRRCHFAQILQIATMHKKTDNEHAIAHQSLELIEIIWHFYRFAVREAVKCCTFQSNDAFALPNIALHAPLNLSKTPSKSFESPIHNTIFQRFDS